MASSSSCAGLAPNRDPVLKTNRPMAQGSKLRLMPIQAVDEGPAAHAVG